MKRIEKSCQTERVFGENRWSGGFGALSMAILLTLAGCGENASEAPAPMLGLAESSPAVASSSTGATPPAPVARPSPLIAEVATSPEIPRIKTVLPGIAPGTVAQPIIRTDKIAAAVQEDADAVKIQKIDAFFDNLKTASFAFNPPSPIKVAKPVTVHFWIDPQTSAATLAGELQQSLGQTGATVESGQTRWSPTMRATLSGPEFEVKAIDQEIQLVSSSERTTWSWDITPLSAGKNLALHLRLEAVLPADLGPPKTITTLDRELTVEVTWWWLFDHYFEKYWKWLLGGLGTAISGLVVWWWKNKQTAAQNTKGT